MIPSAVLFDCDGVLVDTEPATFALIREELAAHGLPMSLEEMETRFIGGTMEGLAAQARALGATLPPDWTDHAYAALYARLGADAPLMPGIEAVLDALDAAGVPYAIGSNGRAAKMAVTLGQHPAFLARFRGHVHSGQDLGFPKPDPRLWRHAAAGLGADPARAVVIEDSATGARAARAAGMVCFAYAPQGAGAAILAEGARPFADYAELPALLGL